MHNLIPRFIEDNVKQGDSHGVFAGAALLVDASGSKVLTDELGKAGTAGAETLAGIFDSVFAPLVETVYSHGGYIVASWVTGLPPSFPDRAMRRIVTPPQQASR